MSYILDALKKSQSQHANDGIAVNIDPTKTNPVKRNWAVWVISAALIANAVIVYWFVIREPTEPAVATEESMAQSAGSTTDTAASNPAVPVTRAPMPQASAEEGRRVEITRELPTRRPLTTGSASTVQENQSPEPASVQSAPPPRVSNAAPPRNTMPARSVSLDELNASERLLYEGFAYTSHIYTDDPTLCAVVIDGQRLQAGDSFKGLIVKEITPSGVIFTERRGNETRHVEVRPFE